MKKKKKNGSAVSVTVILAITACLLAVLWVSSCIGGTGEESGDGSQSTTPQVDGDGSQGADVPENESTSDREADAPVNHEDDWALYVIGNDNPLPADFSVVIKTVSGERALDERCADYAIEMLKAAEKDGIDLYVTSAYRSVQKQAENLESYTNSLIAQGWSAAEADVQAKKEIALPGCSEHNAGLAMDIVSSDYWYTHTDLDESFEELPHFDWLVDNSWKYGFVLSYPKGKEDITGFIYEPWHYRFVGLYHAERIHNVYAETGEFLTVNEYIEKYVN